MKKSFEVNLGGRIFNFDEDAYELLNSYIASLKDCFSKQDGGEEIIADIEVRLSELCETRMSEGRARIVDFSMIDEFITRMGRPEALAQELSGEQEVADETPTADGSGKSNSEPWRDAMLLGKKLFRDMRNGLLGGVFSGLAAYTGVNAWLLRVACLLIFFCIDGLIVSILYIIAWLVLPMASSITDIMRMRDIKPAPGERVEEAWAREYERSSAEIMNGGVVRENKGFLSGCIIALLVIILLPVILLIAFLGTFFNIFGNIGNISPLFASSIDNIFVNLNIMASSIFLPILIIIPLFLFVHHILKKREKVKPLQVWLKILLVALWIIILGVFLGIKEKNVNLPLFKYQKTYTINSDTATPLSHIERFVDDVKHIATSPKISVLKNYFIAPDCYSDSKRCTRMLWHCITSASNDSLVTFASECTQLDDKIIWTLMPRDEWMEYIETPASVSKVEIVGNLNSDVDFSTEICCVIDTVAKRMFIDLPRCKGTENIQIAVNSIPGWSVDYIQDAAVQPLLAHRVELLLKVYSDNDYLPKIVVRTLSADTLSVDTKDMRHTLYRQRIKK